MTLAELKTEDDLALMLKVLREDLFENATFIHRLTESELCFSYYADSEMKAFLAVEENGESVVFAGDWNGVVIPKELLPATGFFTPACDPRTLEQVAESYQIDESWPCWRYRAPGSFGPGPWDELDRLRANDVAFISRYWDLVDEAEEHLRPKVEKYVSACVREGGRPISWAGLHFEIDGMAEMGFAHTLEEYRGKGHASMVSKALVNRVTGKGKAAICHMFKDNLGSIGLCEKLGFERDGEATWAMVGKPL